MYRLFPRSKPKVQSHCDVRHLPLIVMEMVESDDPASKPYCGSLTNNDKGQSGRDGLELPSRYNCHVFLLVILFKPRGSCVKRASTSGVTTLRSAPVQYC